MYPADALDDEIRNFQLATIRAALLGQPLLLSQILNQNNLGMFLHFSRA